MSTSLDVGVIGVGNMGAGMAGNLLARGWTVGVRDLVEARVLALAAEGAEPLPSAAAVAARCDAVIVCVVTAAQCEEVLFGAEGAAQTLQAGQAVILCPTIAPMDTEALGARLTGTGVEFIDAPMSGGPARARDGSMSLMVACDDAVFERRRPLLEALSSRLFRISAKPGDGARTKLVNNLLAGINLVGAAEAMAMAERLGLPLQTMLDVIEQSSGQSWIGSDRMRRALAGDYAPRAHVTLLQKDTALAVQAADHAGFHGPLGAAARDVFAAAAAAGLEGEDDAAIFKLLARPHRG